MNDPHEILRRIIDAWVVLGTIEDESDPEFIEMQSAIDAAGDYLATEKEAEPVSEEIGKALIEMHTNYVATPKVVYQIELNEKAMNADLVAALRFSISKYFDDAYVYGDELLAEVLEDIKNHPPRPEPTRKPMTEEEIGRYLDNECLADFDARIFKWAISIAEKHHGIGGDDE